MSRCLPYTSQWRKPPLAGDDDDLASRVQMEASIKLHKEKEQAKKVMKKEKKREKKDKKASQHLQTSESTLHGHKRKCVDSSSLVGEKDANCMKSSSNDSLEKSGLSEEHEQPFFVQSIRDSPESSQDSSKRRKISSASPSLSRGGNVLRIRLPITKQRDSATPAAIQVPRPRVPEQSARQSIDTKPTMPMVRPTFVQHQSIVKRRETDVSGVLRKVEPRPPARVVQSGSVAIPLPQQVADRSASMPKLKVTSETPIAKQQQQQLLKQEMGPPKEEPCFSGRIAEPQQTSRKSRKAEKKERKLRDLFVTWNPTLLQFEDDVGDQDWLFGGAKRQADVKPSDSNAGEMVQGTDPFFSMQPRAIHLPDLHLYQLPYVVPY